MARRKPARTRAPRPPRPRKPPEPEGPVVLGEDSGTLYVIATPIGNLEDITVRAARLLGEVDGVLAEDTRRTRTLLNHLGHATRMQSLHGHNEKAKVGGVLRRLEAGENLAVVSDAGTPAISDPGAPLVAAVVQAGGTVVPIPGACAVIAALCASGLPTERFQFIGFLPGRPGRRRKLLTEALANPGTTILYASPHRVVKDLAIALEVAGKDRRAVIARELTKIHEEFDRGTLGELVARWTEREPRGEFVVLIGPVVEV
jgi:16S rRNA (cytidine1402-2'-O)-methyltransferase